VRGTAAIRQVSILKKQAEGSWVEKEEGVAVGKMSALENNR
jgi:hypothetical protein